MKFKYRIFSCLLLACFICTMAVAVNAENNIPDLSRRGSVSVTFQDGADPIPGGSLYIYQVAAARVDDGDFYFEYTEPFAACGIDLGDLSASNLAAELTSYAQEKGIEATELTVDENGKVRAENLELGLYLLVQNKPADGYASFRPFLVTVPRTDNGGLVYDVDATPKMGTPPKPTEPTEPTKPTDPTEPEIPYTGQTWWPVPLMAICGLILFAIGWEKCRKGKDDYEA